MLESQTDMTTTANSATIPHETMCGHLDIVNIASAIFLFPRKKNNRNLEWKRYRNGNDRFCPFKF